MSESQEIIKESASVIQEIEAQLERLLSAKKDDINKSLSAIIQKEKDAACKKIEEVERDFEREKEAIQDYRILITEVEAERETILNEIKEHLKRALHYQAEIESLAKQTIEESKKVNELQHMLEALRQRTEERAGFLKKDLRQRFGIIADVPDRQSAVMPPLDLDQELSKLKKIKEMLTDGTFSGAERSGQVGLDSVGEPLRTDSEPGRPLHVPGIHELIQTIPSPEEPKPQERGQKIPSAPENVIQDVEASFPPSLKELKLLRKMEAANGSGEISYYENGDHFVLDVERLLSALEKSLEEAGRLSVRLERTKSPKDLFFIKQELINGQESLRRLMLRVVKLCEKSFPALPTQTSDVFNVQTLRDILEKLSIGNWANPEEFSSFENELKTLRSAFMEKSLPAEDFYRSILEDLEAV